MRFRLVRLVTVLLLLICISAEVSAKKDTIFSSAAVLKIMNRVADWQLDTWKTKGFRLQKADWTNAVCYTGIYSAGTLKGGKKYHEALVNIGNDLGWNTGRHRFYADDYCVAQTFSLLYSTYKDDKMIARFRLQADSIVSNPHDELLNWKNNIHLREWAWCDALFMGPPALAYLSTVTRDAKYQAMANQLWWKTTAFLYDSTEQLYFRDETYFNKKEKNGAKTFWSRGNGWVLGGLVRMLDNIPANDAERARFEQLYKEMMAKIAAIQQPDGSWHASLLDPASFPIKEMSGTGFYCYALVWGLNHGLLDAATYWPVTKKAWAALTSAVMPDGKLGYVQPIGASPDKVEANSTEVYGVGAFLLAGTELYHYLKAHPKAAKL